MRKVRVLKKQLSLDKEFRLVEDYIGYLEGWGSEGVAVGVIYKSCVVAIVRKEDGTVVSVPLYLLVFINEE